MGRSLIASEHKVKVERGDVFSIGVAGCPRPSCCQTGMERSRAFRRGDVQPQLLPPRTALARLLEIVGDQRGGRAATPEAMETDRGKNRGGDCRSGTHGSPKSRQRGFGLHESCFSPLPSSLHLLPVRIVRSVLDPSARCNSFRAMMTSPFKVSEATPSEQTSTSLNPPGSGEGTHGKASRCIM